MSNRTNIRDRAPAYYLITWQGDCAFVREASLSTYLSSLRARGVKVQSVTDLQDLTPEVV